MCPVCFAATLWTVACSTTGVGAVSVVVLKAWKFIRRSRG
jgi:hypothetical protein